MPSAEPGDESKYLRGIQPSGTDNNVDFFPAHSVCQKFKTALAEEHPADEASINPKG